MNYLAHAYLSFNNAEVLAGNMISDFVKGKKQFDYPKQILNGIKLHRSIDHFTDEHPVTKEAKNYLKSAVGLYSGAFIDVAFDHFLANDPNIFNEGSLAEFAQETYFKLDNYYDLLPQRFQAMLPFMKEHNWLYNYKSMWGIQQSFGGVARRAKYLNDSSEVFNAFEFNYIPLQKCYTEFFPQLEKFAAQQLHALIQS